MYVGGINLFASPDALLSLVKGSVPKDIVRFKNMCAITFSELENSIVKVESDVAKKTDQKRLVVVGREPEPFVHPPLLLQRTDSEDSDSPFSVEAIFIEASAAIGKSWIAQFLSARRCAPLLRLDKVPVSSGSLGGLITAEAEEDFHAGKLPVIVDALDEGRLVSHEEHFKAFFETTGEFLSRNREVRRSPKLVFFGRHGAIERARDLLKQASPRVTSASVDVSYFGEKSARKLIRAYGEQADEHGAGDVWQDKGPLKGLLDTYFRAFESALGLDEGTLWDSDEGRAFAGYAPILAEVGRQLGKSSRTKRRENFHKLSVELMKEDSRRGGAWGVIEKVLNWVIERERKDKLFSPLESLLDDPVPEEAYDRIEQLTFLAQHVYQGGITSTGRLRLSAQDAPSYHRLVERHLPEHPFLHRGQLANAVMASVVLAHAVSNDVLRGLEIEQLGSVSHQPFLWRSIQPQLHEDSLLDGSYVGYLFNSLWNDPVLDKARVVIRSTEDGSANVNVFIGARLDTVFQATPPIALYAQSRLCDVNIENEVTLKGQTHGSSRSVFDMNEVTSIVCDCLNIESETITLDGSVWLSANSIASRRNPILYPQEGAQVGWGEELKKLSPWNQIPSEISGPKLGGDDLDSVGWLVQECFLRFPEGMAITLREDLSLSWDNYHLRWAKGIEADLSTLIRLLVNRDLAKKEKKPAGKGDRLVTIRFEFSWSDLLTAAMGEPGAKQKLKDVIAEARSNTQRITEE
jgi:hypothetical protein